jgi:hypothetical protein
MPFAVAALLMKDESVFHETDDTSGTIKKLS